MTLVWRPGNNAITDPDALIYIDKVEKTDGQNLEYDVAKAINDFVVGCKTDGIWDAIKASCILAGARTTNGALVPLVGDAPTPYNFDLVGDTDYDRRTGLIGDGSIKALNTNTNPVGYSAISLAVWLSVASSTNGVYLGSINTGTNVTSDLRRLADRHQTYLRATNSNNPFNRIEGASSSITGLVGASLSGTTQTHRSNRINVTATMTVQSDPNVALGVFGRQTGTGTFGFLSNARISFYSIGESLDLALLDARVTDLMTAIGAAIP